MPEGNRYSRTPAKARRLGQILLGITAVSAILQLAYVLVFTHNQPWADEWEFIPTLCGQESVGKYLWAQHNEHRMPLPRGIWLALFHLTHDFRAGAILQVAIYSALAFAGLRWAAELRGEPSWTDLFFPLSLLHVGHSENLLMGYQLCFAFACLFVIGLARLAMRAKPENRIRTAFFASILSAALCLCGGFGAVFSLPAMVWIWYLTLVPLSPGGSGVKGEGVFPDIPTSPPAPPQPGAKQRCAKFAIAIFSLFPLVYLGFYFQDYHRPEAHPPFEWKNWFAAAQVTMEVLAIGFGIGVDLWGEIARSFDLQRGYLWVPVFFGILYASYLVVAEGIHRFRNIPVEGPRVFGWVAVCVGVCGLALAIGAGRSGFGPDFGLWPRYSILTWPLLAVFYFSAVAWGGPKLKFIPTAFVLASLILYPVNTAYGVARGWYHNQWLGTIETMLLNGVPDAVIVKEQIEETGQGDRAILGIPMLREKKIGPFR